MIATDHYIRYTTVDAVRTTDRGLMADLHGEHLQVDVVRPDVVRLRISRAGAFDETPTPALWVDPLAESVDFTVDEDEARVRLSTSALVVSVWLDPFRIDVHRPDGTAVVETALDEHGRPWAYATLNDAFTVRRRCRQEDAIYGLGEKSGRLNRKGRDFTLWNTDVLDPHAAAEFTAGAAPGDPRGDRTSVEFDPYYVSIPFFYHQIAPGGPMAGSFLDNSYRSHYDFSAPEEYRIHCTGGQYVEYVFAGPTMPRILEAYTELTGRTPAPPLWALGYHQCRWFAYTQDAVELIGAQHRSAAIPCDALWLDIEYMDGYRVFTWDRELFPDPDGMLARLAEQGFRVITIIDPGVKYDPGYEVFDAAVERDVLCRTEGGGLYIGQVWPGNTAFPDFVTEEGRRWWGELNAAHVQSGLAGIWNDMNEPATGNIAPDRMRFGRGEFSHERYHNQYALLMAMGTVAGLREAIPDRRTFVLSRSGFAGIQRYAANWLGDNQSRWDHLWVSIPMAAGFGLSGQAFVGADIGGFQGNSNAELYLRWMQYGVFTPFCRNHSEIANVDQYAWSFGPVVQDLVRQAIELRYRLLPYLYAAFCEAAASGAPVQRPLVYSYADDAGVQDLDDQFLLGSDLLVAPVLEPGQTARQVYLPAGDWYDWYSGERHPGRRFLRVDTPMDRIPLFARGGALIPMWPEAPPSTEGYHPEEMELRLFVPGAAGTSSSTWQEDDGLTFAFAEGRCHRTVAEVARTGDSVTLRVRVSGDGYPEFARARYRLVVHGATPASVRLDGAEVAGTDGSFLLERGAEDFEVSFTAP